MGASDRAVRPPTTEVVASCPERKTSGGFVSSSASPAYSARMESSAPARSESKTSSTGGAKILVGTGAAQSSTAPDAVFGGGEQPRSSSSAAENNGAGVAGETNGPTSAIDQAENKISARTKPGSTTSTAGDAGASPPLTPLLKHQDTYGFDAQVDDKQYEEGFAPKKLRRKDRFPKILPAKFSEELRALCRKGVPDERRGEVWAYCLGADLKRKANAGVFGELKKGVAQGKLDPSVKTQIELDLDRTFCSHEKIQAGKEDLRDILECFALRKPDIGYCQGLNYVVCRMLLFLDAETTFWALDCVMDGYYPLTLPKQHDGWELCQAGYYLPGMRLLRADSAALRKLIIGRRAAGIWHPELDVAFQAPWFLTLFAGPQGLPSATLFRLWDVLFAEGIKVVFRIALALVSRAGIKKNDTLEICHTKLKTTVAGACDHNELLKEAFRLRRFSRDELHSLRRKCYEEADNPLAPG
mmetsp:Transcript_4947/g.12404  ORF Transcript_4947/g.12404 Transcript_4947/m.12404 type:complete len:471 (-) Transcript_4947:629-2041(-)|eukprot:CAMPEP_0179002612 /NCGR_PEP_ID=MMETSP0795-20121207/12152_1 /TAXON_ID=88552 /ORGANISM="Amoebophrya sp., Strain Ameob2" /LENGTH=470 /DNA_ID=CAMNT_0020696395 /DNA_START=246 /DNA_END=1658 /DNA_ORIENTATION=-